MESICSFDEPTTKTERACGLSHRTEAACNVSQRKWRILHWRSEEAGNNDITDFRETGDVTGDYDGVGSRGQMDHWVITEPPGAVAGRLCQLYEASSRHRCLETHAH